MTTKEYELSRIEFEMARNKAMDEYFNARLNMERTVLNEWIFELSFEYFIAFEILLSIIL